jgi:hypothetical protein
MPWEILRLIKNSGKDKVVFVYVSRNTAFAGRMKLVKAVPCKTVVSSGKDFFLQTK